MKIKILLTGGSGFIGKNLIKILLKKKKCKILSISRKLNQNKLNLKWIKGDYGSLTKKKFDEIKKFKPEIVVHLGWQDIPNFSSKISKINLAKSKFFIKKLVKIESIKKIIMTGSCNEYLYKKGKVNEKKKLDNSNFFSKSKIELLKFSKNETKKNNIKFYWLRIFYVYGPHQREGSIVPYLVKNILQEKKIKIKNPNINLDFIYIADVTKLIENFIYKNLTQGVYNIGTGKKTSILEIYKHLNLILDKRKKTYKILRTDFFISDNSKIKKLVKDFKYTNIKNGLLKYIKWFNKS